MTLAHRIGLTDHRWYQPSALILGAFAAGVQLALLYQLQTQPGGYPPAGKGLLAWSSLAVLALLAVLHAPLDRARDLLDQAVAAVARRQESVGSEPDEASEAGLAKNGSGHPAPPAVNAAPVRQRLKVRVHSPLMVGPVVAPGETVPLHVQAEPEELARELEVTFHVRENRDERETTVPLTSGDLVHTETFQQPGPLVVEVRVQHPEASAPATKRIEGRVATYREEVGRLFDDLRDRTIDAGLDVGPQSTPREVCRGLPSVGTASYEDAEALRTHLEVALYGEDEVDRTTYEAVHTILRDAGLLEEGEAARA